MQAAAKTGNQQVLKIQAKSLIRLRGQIGKLQASIAQLKGVSTQMTVRAHGQCMPHCRMASSCL